MEPSTLGQGQQTQILKNETKTRETDFIITMSLKNSINYLFGPSLMYVFYIVTTYFHESIINPNIQTPSFYLRLIKKLSFRERAFTVFRRPNTLRDIRSP